MSVFPENPCEFAIDFIRKMRGSPDIVQMPSSRQVLSIPKLILSRYYRKGSISPNDYIEISVVTSFPDNQELAKDIAFQILFPNYRKDMLDSFFRDDVKPDKEKQKFLDENLKTELDKIQEIIDEIEVSKNVKQETIESLEKFLEELSEMKEEEPYKSSLEFFGDNSEFFKEEIFSLEQMIEEAKKRFEQRINSLEPSDIKAGSKLGLNDLVQEKSLREWEKISSKALSGIDIKDDLERLLDSGKLNDLLKTMKFLNETSREDSIKAELNHLKNKLRDHINNLEQLFNAAKTLGELPNFDKEKVLGNSSESSSFEHNYNLANSLDQFFGSNLRAELLDKFQEQMSHNKMNLSLESLTKSAYTNKSWNELFNQALKKAIKDATKQPVKYEAFKNLSHQLQQLMNSCENMHCSQKIAQNLPDLTSQTLEACKNADQLRDATEFLRKIGLEPNSESIQQVGEKLGMSDEDIFELIEPNYQLLKKMIDNSSADFQRIQHLMNQIRDQINYDRMKELTASAFSRENREALAALGHFNLSDSLKAAQSIGGDEGQDKMIACLSAGSGENLLKEWFIHRKEIPERSKQKVKELAKKLLIELGIYYSRARLGSATTGPIPINIVRPYSVGDDFENIDLEETLFNLLEKGKKLDYIDYDDFYVYETAKGLRSCCIELDISGSMSGEKLAYMSICVTMLCYGMRKDEFAITFFESDTHVLKKLDEKVDLEKLADELLSVSARGGTRMQNALEWANKQFKDHSSSREKLNILFTDAEIFDIRESM
ncbi:MAG: VWA domain-containing protein, partial [Promethearchaeota archaeon]